MLDNAALCSVPEKFNDKESTRLADSNGDYFCKWESWGKK